MTRRRAYPRGSSTERGYGYTHQQERARLLPHAYGTVCPLGCGRVMVPGMALDLDHVIPLAVGGGAGPRRIVCARCNRARGARLGAARRWARRRAASLPPSGSMPTSREW